MSMPINIDIWFQIWIHYGRPFTSNEIENVVMLKFYKKLLFK